MSRMMSLILAATATALLTPMIGRAQDSGVKIGEWSEGEIPSKAAKTTFKVPQKRGGAFGGPVKTSLVEVPCVSAEIPVDLKAGQNLAIQVTVAGNTRKVAVALKDPSGAQVSQTENFSAKKAELKVEANATGTSTILIFSDLSGAYKVRVVSEGGDGADDEADAKALEEKIQQLEQDLRDAKAKLNAIKKKATAKRK